MDDDTSEFFAAAAACLAGQTVSDPRLKAAAGHLLDILNSQDSSAGASSDHGGQEVIRSDIHLLQSASRLRRIFQFDAPDAPGLYFLAGEADPTLVGLDGKGFAKGSTTGTGLEFRRALWSCVGEAIEYFCRLEWGDEAKVITTFDEACAFWPRDSHESLLARWPLRDGQPDTKLEWLRASRLSDGRETLVPLDICLTRWPDRSTAQPTLNLSSGCAAGQSYAAAALSAVLELIERDAAALWWRGGRPARVIDVSGKPRVELTSLLFKLRGCNPARPHTLLDISSDLGIPTVAAISFDQKGHGFACGLAARPSYIEAIRAAILEMCQMEAGHSILDLKRRQDGEAALNRNDRKQIERSEKLRESDVIHAASEEGLVLEEEAEPRPAKRQLDRMAKRLAAAGIDIHLVDQTRPEFRLAAVRAISFELQPMDTNVISPRLRNTLDQTGGGPYYKHRVNLL